MEVLHEVNHRPEQPSPRGMSQRGPPVAVLVIDVGAYREQLPQHRPASRVDQARGHAMTHQQ